MLQKIQLIALRGWREAMMAPTTEKVRTVARVKTALTGSASLSFGSSSTMDIVMRANEIPPTSSAAASATSDHANQVSALLFIPPTLSAGVSSGSPLLYMSRETPEKERGRACRPRSDRTEGGLILRVASLQAE